MVSNYARISLDTTTGAAKVAAPDRDPICVLRAFGCSRLTRG